MNQDSTAATIELPKRLYTNTDLEGCSKPGCECWDCTCEGYYNVDRTKWEVWRANDIGFMLKCERDPAVADRREDLYMKKSKEINVADPYIPDPCGALERQDEVEIEKLTINGTYF